MSTVSKRTDFTLKWSHKEKDLDRGNLPHEISKVTRCDVALACSVKSLESRVWFESLGLAKVLPAELNALLALTGVGEKLGLFLLSQDRHVCSFHHFDSFSN